MVKSFKEFYFEQSEYSNNYKDNFNSSLNKQHRGLSGDNRIASRGVYPSKHVNMIPNKYKLVGQAKTKVERIKSQNNTGTIPLNDTEVQDVAQMYHIRDLDELKNNPQSFRALGKTGIKMFFDPNTNRFSLIK